jgi:septum site-determining protein MinD
MVAAAATTTLQLGLTSPRSQLPNKTLANPSPPMAFAPPRLLPLPPPPAAASTRAVSARNHGGRTAPELSGPTPRVVVVTSGKGGVGKTTTTANLAASLARLGLPAVAVDADAGLRNLDLLLGLENRVHLTAADVLAGDCRLDQALVRHRALHDLHLLCLSKPRSKLPLAFGSKTLTWVADALRRSTSPPAFILIDCPAGQL